LILKFPTWHFMCARISSDVLEKIAVGLALAANLVFALILLVARDGERSAQPRAAL